MWAVVEHTTAVHFPIRMESALTIHCSKFLFSLATKNQNFFWMGRWSHGTYCMYASIHMSHLLTRPFSRTIDPPPIHAYEFFRTIPSSDVNKKLMTLAACHRRRSPRKVDIICICIVYKLRKMSIKTKFFREFWEFSIRTCNKVISTECGAMSILRFRHFVSQQCRAKVFHGQHLIYYPM